MICFANPGLTDNLCVLQKVEFSITCYMTKCTLDERPSIFKRDKPIFSLKRKLHKDYYSKRSVEKTSLIMGLKGLGAKTNRLAVNRQS
jgi:hypothetical protein